MPSDIDEEYARVLLRLPAELLASIRDAARRDHRSVNAEIITWLGQYRVIDEDAHQDAHESDHHHHKPLPTR